jgi:hypothetical protein
MATRIKLLLQDEENTDRNIAQAEAKGWTRLTIGQPVPWPQVNRFIDELPGEYISVSRPYSWVDGVCTVREVNDMVDQSWRQFFWFSSPRAAFAFKLKFG